MAHFDRVIPPGGEGKVTLKVHTKGRQGKFIKSARVYSNDPKQKIITLKMVAHIKVPIYLSTKYVYFFGNENQAMTRVVQIEAKLERPLELNPRNFTVSNYVDYEIKELQKGKKYMVQFKNKPGVAENYRGYLKIGTNYPEKPELTIWVRGRFLKKQAPRHHAPASPQKH